MIRALAFALVTVFAIGAAMASNSARPFVIPDVVAEKVHQPGYRFAPCPVEPWEYPPQPQTHQA